MIKSTLWPLALLVVAALLALAGPLGSLAAYAVVAGSAGVLSLRLPERHSKSIGVAALVFVFAHVVRAAVGPAAYDVVLGFGYIFIAYATYLIFRSSSRRLEPSLALEAGAIGTALATVLAFNPYFEVPSAKLFIVALATSAVLFMLMSDLGRRTVPIVKMYLLSIVVATWMEAFAHLFPEAIFSAMWTAPYYSLIAGLLLPPHLRQLSPSYVPARRRFGPPQLVLYGATTATASITAYLNGAMPLLWTTLSIITAALIFTRISLLVRQRDWSFEQERELRRFSESLISLTSTEEIDSITMEALRSLGGDPDRVAIVDVDDAGAFHTVADHHNRLAAVRTRTGLPRRPTQIGDLDGIQGWFSPGSLMQLAVCVPTGRNEQTRYFVCESSRVINDETEDHFRSAAAQYALAFKTQELTAQIKEQTARLAVEQARREAHEAWQALTVGSHEVALRIHDGIVSATTPQPELILGFDPLDHRLEDLAFLHPDHLDGASFQNPQRTAQWLKVTEQTAADGSQVFTIREVTDEVIDASTDSVTGLPMISALPPHDVLAVGAIHLLDFDGLDQVRERHGRAASEHALQILTARLTTQFRSDEDRFWRGDGNRLVVATDEPLTEEALEQRISGLGAPIVTDAFEHEPMVTVAAVDVDPSLNVGAIMQRLQIALGHGLNNKLRVARFTDELYAAVRRQWSLEQAFKRSLADPAHGGFTVHYQPLVSAKPSARTVAVEALARWMHPDLGGISPGEFVPMAEELGMIDALDDFVLNQALRDLDAFHKVDPNLAIHVNMSPKGSLANKLDAVRNTVIVHGIEKAGSLVVEVTESALGRQPRQELLQSAQQLRNLGIGLAVDDFGSGESNFDRVAELPFSEVKLARNFADADHVMLASLIHSFHSLELVVVAENIETIEQVNRMRDAHCDIIQGFYYKRPADIGTITKWIADRALDALPATSDTHSTGDGGGQGVRS